MIREENRFPSASSDDQGQPLTPDRHKLLWHCRRGMLELDLLLRDFLEHGYERMDEAGQHNFARLLELPDQELFDYLMEQKTPRERGIADVIEKICRATKA